MAVTNIFQRRQRSIAADTPIQLTFIRNDSVPIQLAQCRVSELAIADAKIFIHIFQIKYTDAILSYGTRKLLWFEITEMLIAV